LPKIASIAKESKMARVCKFGFFGRLWQSLAISITEENPVIACCHCQKLPALPKNPNWLAFANLDFLAISGNLW